ncbi:hypothetical protein ACVGXT_13570, partial [Enterobacter intestinihominis]
HFFSRRGRKPIFSFDCGGVVFFFIRQVHNPQLLFKMMGYVFLFFAALCHHPGRLQLVVV